MFPHGAANLPGERCPPRAGAAALLRRSAGEAGRRGLGLGWGWKRAGAGAGVGAGAGGAAIPSGCCTFRGGGTHPSAGRRSRPGRGSRTGSPSCLCSASSPRRGRGGTATGRTGSAAGQGRPAAAASPRPARLREGGSGAGARFGSALGSAPPLLPPPPPPPGLGTAAPSLPSFPASSPLSRRPGPAAAGKLRHGEGGLREEPPHTEYRGYSGDPGAGDRTGTGMGQRGERRAMHTAVGTPSPLLGTPGREGGALGDAPSGGEAGLQPGSGAVTADAPRRHGEGGPSPPAPPPSPSPTRSAPRSPPPPQPHRRSKAAARGQAAPRGAGRASHGPTATLGSAAAPGYPPPAVSEPVRGTLRELRRPRGAAVPRATSAAWAHLPACAAPRAPLPARRRRAEHPAPIPAPVAARGDRGAGREHGAARREGGRAACCQRALVSSHESSRLSEAAMLSNCLRLKIRAI